MRTIWSTLWLRTVSMSEQMVNDTNLWAEESWAVRTRNGGGSGWCGSAFSKFPAQLSCFVYSGFTDFRSTFDNFTPLHSVLRQIFQAIRGDTKSFHGDLQCVFEALFGGLFGCTYSETVHRRAVSLGCGDLSCGQHDQPNVAVIASRWCRWWEKKPEVKLGIGMSFWHVMPRIFLI